MIVSVDWKPALKWVLLSSLLKTVGKGRYSSSVMTKVEQDGGLPAPLNRPMSADDQNREQSKLKRGPASIPQMPRSLKYAWGAGVTLLVGLSLVVDRGSAWMPLIHRAIDLLQTQTAPTENK